VLRRIHAEAPDVPVLFLTAKDQVEDRIAGLTAGGDDYVSKPFALVELVARLQALVRRGGSEAAVEAVGLRLDPVSHTVGAEGVEVPLTPTEFRLLARLLTRPGEAVRRRDLVRAGWPHGAIVRENTLDAYVARLRRKLRGLEGAPEIATVHSVGYRIQ
jgi:two-component system OmpR family response regulator